MKRLFLIGGKLNNWSKGIAIYIFNIHICFLNCRRILEFVYSKFVKKLDK